MEMNCIGELIIGNGQNQNTFIAPLPCYVYSYIPFYIRTYRKIYAALIRLLSSLRIRLRLISLKKNSRRSSFFRRAYADYANKYDGSGKNFMLWRRWLYASKTIIQLSFWKFTRCAFYRPKESLNSYRRPSKLSPTWNRTEKYPSRLHRGN